MASVSEHVAKTNKEKSKTRYEAPIAAEWIGKLRQNTTPYSTYGAEHFNVQREVLLWGFV